MYIKALKWIAGSVLIALGVIGLFLPLIPGVLLILAGLVLIEVKVSYLKKLLKKWIKKIGF